MNRRQLVKASLLISTAPLLARASAFKIINVNYVRLLRHATLHLSLGNVQFLVDPMLSVKEAMDPVANAGNEFRIPMTDLPVNPQRLREIIAGVDAILLTHLHRDHWDKAAQEIIPPNKPIYCQPGDKEKIQSQGFEKVTAIDDVVKFQDITIHRTGGRHGLGSIGEKMGAVSGYVLQHDHCSIYIAGDTVYCEEVQSAIKQYLPSCIIVNSGEATFINEGPITMDANNVVRTYKESSSSKFIAVHMDTVNHCKLTRAMLREELCHQGLETKISLPKDGETIYL